MGNESAGAQLGRTSSLENFGTVTMKPGSP